MTIGGQEIEVKPVDLEGAVKLVLLLGPYVALLEDHLGEFNRLLGMTGGKRPQLLTAFLMVLADQIDPHTITEAFMILLDKPGEWFRGVKPVELVRALPALDKVNDFGMLFDAIKGLGLAARYSTARNGNSQDGQGNNGGTD